MRWTTAAGLGVAGLGVIILAPANAQPGRTATPAEPAAVSLKGLPPITRSKAINVEYKVDPYIAAASALQALGKEKARRRLAELALEEQALPIVEQSGNRTFVLCR